MAFCTVEVNSGPPVGIGKPGRVSGSYGYDGDGRRVVRSDSQGTSRFVYDGDQVVEVLSASNAVVEYRTPGVGFVRNGAQRYELDSALGSNLDTRDQSGANTGLTEYDAYGREVYQDIFVDRGDFRFGGAHGYANDDATGWQQLGARLYIPGIGRFLTQDPLGQEGGLNLYAYCENSPLTRTDASGHGPEGVLAAVMQAMYPAHYDTMEHAGIAAIQSVMSRSQGEAVEYGGLIYQYPDKSWSYTPGLHLQPTGQLDHCNPFMGIPFLPRNVTVPGNYHTHPEPPGDYGDVTASQPDRNQADFRLYAQYKPYSGYDIRFWFVGSGFKEGIISEYFAGSPAHRGSGILLHGWNSFGKGPRPTPNP